MMTGKTKIIGIISLAYVFIAVAVLSSVIFEVITAGQALTERVTAIADKNAKVKVYSELSNLVKATKDQRETLSGFVLTEENTSAFLTDIESIGMSQNVTLTTDSLQVTKQDGLFDLLSIQFTLEGSESSVAKMLMVFETLPYHSLVSSLTYERVANGGVKSTLGLEVTLLKHVQ